MRVAVAAELGLEASLEQKLEGDVLFFELTRDVKRPLEVPGGVELRQKWLPRRHKASGLLALHFVKRSP